MPGRISAGGDLRVLLAVGIGFTLNGLLGDIDAAHTPPVATGAFVLLGIALLIALGFEFVNGFHDTANAVATVIYTHSLQPHVAVVWSGAFNFLGVWPRRGAVAFSILTLLPVELILHVGSSAGFAMIFALLMAAIVWNLGTWFLGLPAEFVAHANRLDPRCRPCQPAHGAGELRHLRCRLGAGEVRVPRAAVQPARRISSAPRSCCC